MDVNSICQQTASAQSDMITQILMLGIKAKNVDAANEIIVSQLEEDTAEISEEALELLSAVDA